MTYLQFLVIFLVVPLACGIILARSYVRVWMMVALAVISLVALTYTAPWDNWIVVQGVWSYAPHQVIGLLIGHIPLEEYVFYVLQVFLTGILTVTLLQLREVNR